MPVQWVMSCVQWAAGEKNVPPPPQAAVEADYAALLAIQREGFYVVEAIAEGDLRRGGAAGRGGQ